MVGSLGSTPTRVRVLRRSIPPRRPRPEPIVPWTCWMVEKMPPTLKGLPKGFSGKEGEARRAGHGEIQEGHNDHKLPGKLLSDGHRFEFKLYALDDKIHLDHKMQHNIFTTMRSLKIVEGCKSSPICPIPLSGTGGGGGGGGMREKLLHHLHDQVRVNSIRSKSIRTCQPPTVAPDMLAETLLPYGLPVTDIIEPQIEPCLKPVDFVETLARTYRNIEGSPQLEKLDAYLEQCTLFKGLDDSKLFLRSLRSARQHAADVHTKVVLAAWLRYERREDELIGTSSMDCCGRNLECPKVNLVPGYDPKSVFDGCSCSKSPREEDNIGNVVEMGYDQGSSGFDEEDEDIGDMAFCIGDEEVRCCRHNIAMLSRPFKTMLYGGFGESHREKINFTKWEVSIDALKAVEEFSRTRKLSLHDPHITLELLSFANRFCCDEIKAACDGYLSSLVMNMDEAVILIDYGLEEEAFLLIATCLQVILRETPGSIQNPRVLKLFCSSEAREKLAQAGHASFVLYFFLSHISMEIDVKSTTTVMLLERLVECAADNSWQKQLALHQLGVVMLERKEYKDAQHWFEAAVEAGHVYSLIGVARSKYKRGHKYAAFKVMSSLISDHPLSGWMYQERSLYCVGQEKIDDLTAATRLDPTLSFPYKYRAVMLTEENKMGASISEINKIIRFKASPDCLELRAWLSIALQDYDGALRDVRALLTLDSNYMMFNGKMNGDQLVELLQPHVLESNQADCWMQLYDRWSCVDDIGSLAVVHQMLQNDPGRSLLRFRLSLLLLRLNCQKAGMRSLRLARNYSNADHERLVYEGWILYDTGYREEALAKVEESIAIQRSFEAFFLKAYALADTNLDLESSTYVIQLLEEALKCPSDGLRKGQALNNLGSIYVDCDKLDLATNCFTNALNIKHTRAHQGLARVYHLKNQCKTAYAEMTKLIEKAHSNASAYEKRSEYCDRDMAKNDLSMATQLDPLRTYPYRYRAAVLMDDHKEEEAIAELSRAISFKLDLQLLHLRAAFHDSIGNLASTLRDCEAALCLDPGHADTLNLYAKAQELAKEQH